MDGICVLVRQWRGIGRVAKVETKILRSGGATWLRSTGRTNWSIRLAGFSLIDQNGLRWGSGRAASSVDAVDGSWNKIE